MIQPHSSSALNGRYVDDADARAALEEDAKTLPTLLLNSTAATNAVMLGSGYFNPLSGFMDKADALSVARDMYTRSGLFWPIPILNLMSEEERVRSGERVALRDPNVAGMPVLAVQEVESVEIFTDKEIRQVLTNVYRTTDPEHPGVATFTALGRQVVSGPVEVLNYSYFETNFPATFRTAGQIRNEIRNHGWETVVAFQTRNPMHRAHEELCKIAREALAADGILIHMLLGKLKPGDISAEVRDAAIRKMVKLYFPKNSVIMAGYGFDMLYAGPREAVLHAIFRQNAGCTHLIVGRDHAGVGEYYGSFDAQAIFDEEVPPGSLAIQIFRADHTAYSKKLQRVVMMRDVPDHATDDFVLLSGTRVREMLEAGEALPVEIARPEVAQILMDHYHAQK
jgi:sulfate adenylyltransferase